MSNHFSKYTKKTSALTFFYIILSKQMHFPKEKFI